MHRLPALALIALLLPACGGTPSNPDSSGSRSPAPPPAPPKPWTNAFREEAVLVADVVRIEGPEGLREHLAQHQDPLVADYAITMTSAGLLQVTSAKTEGLAPGEFRELRLQLDAWSIVATQRLEVLERPVEVAVSVVATGNASFTQLGTGERRAGVRLDFRGERPK